MVTLNDGMNFKFSNLKDLRLSANRFLSFNKSVFTTHDIMETNWKNVNSNGESSGSHPSNSIFFPLIMLAISHITEYQSSSTLCNFTLNITAILPCACHNPLAVSLRNFNALHNFKLTDFDKTQKLDLMLTNFLKNAAENNS